jgi:excisionase family DNA binding protein
VTKIMPWEQADMTLLTPAEVAAKAGVDAKTVTRWANEGKLACIRTPGGHRRYRLADVEKLLFVRGAEAGRQ